ncbi:MAG TPA: hypothetical protein VGL22_13825 [Terracidiphilus sp.]|jgi:hypothetical protein
MDIGPVNSIRPVSPVRPSPPGFRNDSELSGVFATEFRSQQRDESYSQRRNVSRGLEDEETDGESSEAGTAGELQVSDSSSTIRLIA